jgi:hypothetical protein
MFNSRLFAALALITAAAGGRALLSAGLYGFTLFVVVPIVLACAACALAPKMGGALLGAGVSFAALAVLLLTHVEGLGCLVMASPLVAGAGALGGWMVSRASRARDVALLLAAPATLAFDATARPPLYEARTAIEIAAPPERVWHNVVAFPELPPPREWYFHTGLAYPVRARIEGGVRYCEFSTGAFVEPIEVSDAPRLLRFRVTENPAPMREWSPFGDVRPKHLHGYLVSERGQFRLTPLTNGRTLLEGTTWYRHGLWPAQYWRWWSDAIIHRIHLRVLRHIGRLSVDHAVQRPPGGVEQLSDAAPIAPAVPDQHRLGAQSGVLGEL